MCVDGTWSRMAQCGFRNFLFLLMPSLAVPAAAATLPPCAMMLLALAGNIRVANGLFYF